MKSACYHFRNNDLRINDDILYWDTRDQGCLHEGAVPSCLASWALYAEEMPCGKLCSGKSGMLKVSWIQRLPHQRMMQAVCMFCVFYSTDKFHHWKKLISIYVQKTQPPVVDPEFPIGSEGEDWPHLYRIPQSPPPPRGGFWKPLYLPGKFIAIVIATDALQGYVVSVKTQSSSVSMQACMCACCHGRETSKHQHAHPRENRSPELNIFNGTF